MIMRSLERGALSPLLAFNSRLSCGGLGKCHPSVTLLSPKGGGSFKRLILLVEMKVGDIFGDILPGRWGERPREPAPRFHPSGTASWSLLQFALIRAIRVKPPLSNQNCTLSALKMIYFLNPLISLVQMKVGAVPGAILTASRLRKPFVEIFG